MNLQGLVAGPYETPESGGIWRETGQNGCFGGLRGPGSVATQPITLPAGFTHLVRGRHHFYSPHQAWESRCKPVWNSMKLRFCLQAVYILPVVPVFLTLVCPLGPAQPGWVFSSALTGSEESWKSLLERHLEQRRSRAAGVKTGTFFCWAPGGKIKFSLWSCDSVYLSGLSELFRYENRSKIFETWTIRSVCACGTSKPIRVWLKKSNGHAKM